MNAIVKLFSLLKNSLADIFVTEEYDKWETDSVFNERISPISETTTKQKSQRSHGTFSASVKSAEKRVHAFENSLNKINKELHLE